MWNERPTFLPVESLLQSGLLHGKPTMHSCVGLGGQLHAHLAGADEQTGHMPLSTQLQSGKMEDHLPGPCETALSWGRVPQ